MSTRIETHVGDIHVDITVENEEIATLGIGVLNPLDGLVTAIRATSNALGVPVADLAAALSRQ